jgi:hypothetical protein
MTSFHPASPISVAAFILVVAGVLLALLASILHAYGDDAGRAARNAILTFAGLSAWIAAFAVLISTGRITTLPWNGLPLFFGSVAVISIGFGLSPIGRQIAATVALRHLVLFQGFRMSLELVLHSWALQGTVPETMSWNGQNLDVVTGIVALVSFGWADRRAVAWFANIVGAVLLLNVLRVALYSSPLPFAWNVQPPLLLAVHLPYALIGPVCVGGALAGHVVLTRALLRPTSKVQPSPSRNTSELYPRPLV